MNAKFTLNLYLFTWSNNAGFWNDVAVRCSRHVNMGMHVNMYQTSVVSIPSMNVSNIATTNEPLFAAFVLHTTANISHLLGCAVGIGPQWALRNQYSVQTCAMLNYAIYALGIQLQWFRHSVYLTSVLDNTCINMVISWALIRVGSRYCSSLSSVRPVRARTSLPWFHCFVFLKCYVYITRILAQNIVNGVLHVYINVTV